MPPQCIIIGGGITGLSAAYELAQRGLRPRVFEASGRLGGVIQTESVEGCVIEGGPDSFLSAKPAGLELITELGLAGELIGSNDRQRVTYIVKRGRLVPMPDGLLMMIPTKVLPVAASGLLSWSTKIRMGLDYFRAPARTPPPERTVARFIEEHYGRDAVDYLADPLLSGVYGGSADSLSVNSVLGRFVELETRYGSLTKGVLAARRQAGSTKTAPPLFQTLKCGLGGLVQALVRTIGARMDVAYESVHRVERTADGFRVFAGGSTFEAGRVIFACPAWRAAALVAPIHARLAELLSGIEYSSSVTLALGLNHAECGPIPPGFGFLVPKREQRLLVACTFTGAKFPNRVPDDKVVMRCFLGGAGRDAVLDMSDDALVETVCREMNDLLGWRPRPAFHRVSRWPKAMAQYTLGHQERVDEIRTLVRGIPGLFLAGNAYDGIGIPDCIRTGRAAAAEASRLSEDSHS